MIRERLLKMQDIKYKEFHQKLMPTIPSDRVIGIQIPKLRAYAKEIAGSKEAEKFLKELPHEYYEENNLHAFLIERYSGYQQCIEAVEEFLPYVDNWATCDSLRPKVFKKNKEKLMVQIEQWLVSEHPYTVRFGIEALMVFYLDEDFKEEYPEKVAAVSSEEYYVKMMVAWYFATALAKQYDATVPYLQQQRLEPWTHNKAIQKAIESRRISPEEKAYLKTLKV